MDQETRNKLQRATQQIRRLLEDEFAEELEGTFDILPSGKILDSAGKHLIARERLVRRKLVEAIEHIKAGGKKSKEAVDEYTREAAFTFLNRFVALRMLEARGLLQECVSKGDASSGFKEFCGLAPGLSSLEDGGYRLYLECLFDELTVEVKVLFDRRDAASLLWPRRSALKELLDVLNQAELTSLWEEDETIGWVYQYFNSSEERRKMREESQAPRDSRELAVRNQFFTPRYVVEFLTDNTLGRIWYEMRKGRTRLVEQCQYLVRRPSEMFFEEGQQPPVDKSESDQDLSQRELLRKTVYIQHRAKKDPRDLKVLDPACGSGHFLLYAFSLLITIYEEAWDDDDSPAWEITGGRLRDDYQELSQLHGELPGLILAHNLHGIDIDARAAQIAALALWMRGQRAFNDSGITREQRQPITRSNIVCAEPMPGESAFLDEFISQHLSNDAEGRFLASLVKKVFESMNLAGEAGSLLRIEEDIAEEVVKAKEQWLERPEFKQQMLFDEGRGYVQKQLNLTRGITAEAFWEEAEERIYDALRAYSEQAERIGGFQRRLFAVDAARGFAFIDLCRTRYDVALMNPPFGPGTESSKSYIESHFLSSKQDLATCFVERMLLSCNESGIVGAITTRTPFFLSSLGGWRQTVLSHCQWISTYADLGYGVLDAVVETAAYCLSKRSGSQRATFLDLLDAVKKDAPLREAANKVEDSVRAYCVDTTLFSELEGSPALYWCPESLLKKFYQSNTLEPTQAAVKRGVATGDNFRFLRLWPEVEENSIGFSLEFTPYAKGGEYAPYFFPVTLVLKWSEEGKELRNLFGANGRLRSRPQNIDAFGKPGLAYPSRTTSGFGPRLLQGGCGFDQTSNPIIPKDESSIGFLVSLLMSRVAWLFIELQVGMGDTSQSGTAARDYTNGLIGRCPLPLVSDEVKEQLSGLGLACIAISAQLYSRNELNPDFIGFFEIDDHAVSVAELVEFRLQENTKAYCKLLELSAKADELVGLSFGLTSEESDFLNRIVGPHPANYPVASNQPLPERLFTKKCYWASSALERVCHRERVHPRDAAHYREFTDLERAPIERKVAFDIVSWGVGAIYGRWPESFDVHQGEIDAGISDWSLRQSRGVGIAAIFVDDVGSGADFTSHVEESLQRIWGDTNWEQIRPDVLRAWKSERSLRDLLAKKFFDSHCAIYTEHSRSAPIYWQLATPSASYSVWLYYHRLSRDTVFQVLNEFVKPRVKYERQRLERLRAEGGEPTRSQRKEIEDQEKLLAELTGMVEELERIAPLWNPNLSDGVIINFAPLWRLIPQNKPWQKECKNVWDKMVKGEYDWAHLAMNLWPERVVPKCVTDASLAIAHGLEEEFWSQDDRERFQPKEEPEGGWGQVVERLVKERTSPAVKAALQSLLDAPVPSSNSGRSRRR